MSKVEKALHRIRNMEPPREAPVREPAPRENAHTVSPALEGSQQLIRTSTELQPYRPQIGNMVEPWRLSETELADARIIYPEMEHKGVAEAFRAIRTSIVQQYPAGNCTVLVTSVVEDGGASFVALNLAAAFAFDASRTALLIDCNLREPSYRDLVSPDMQYGLTDYLEGNSVDATQVIHPAGIPRFRLIPAGHPTETTTEQLDSKKMRELLASVKARYPDRYTILDTRAICESPDAKILASLADFVILVVPYGRVTQLEIWNAAKSIDERKLLGVVFNDEPELPRLAWN